MSDRQTLERIIHANRLSRRRLLGATVGLGGAAALGPIGGAHSWAGARSVAAQETPKSGGSLRVAFYSDAATMDPHFSGHKVDRQVYFNVYEPLVSLAPTLEIEPGLAESWETPDPTTYIFHLRQGVTFHDGTEFNAEAVKVNFDRMMDPEQQSLRRGEVASIAAVEVVDPATVKFTLNAPDAALLATLTDRTGMIISPAAIEQFGEDLARNPVGTGPYQFVEWQKDDHLTLKRFDGYWNEGLPYLDEITYRVILDDTVRIAALRNEEIDIVDYVPPAFVADTKGDDGLVTIDIPSLGVWWLWLNGTKPPFDNPALRQAFASAFAVQPIVERIFLDVGVPANGPISPASWAYDESIPARQIDLELAKAKLAEGGQPDGFKCVFKTATNPINLQVVQLIQAQVAEVGIEMEITQVDAASQIAATVAKDYEVAFAQWSGRPDPDGNTYQHFHAKGGMNYGGYDNPEVNELLDQARAVAAPEERKQLYTRVTNILHEDVPAVFIWHPDEPKAMTTKLHDVPPVPDGMMRFGSAWLE